MLLSQEDNNKITLSAYTFSNASISSIPVSGSLCFSFVYSPYPKSYCCINRTTQSILQRLHSNHPYLL